MAPKGLKQDFSRYKKAPCKNILQCHYFHYNGVQGTARKIKRLSSPNQTDNKVLLISTQKSLIQKISALMTSDFQELALEIAEAGSNGLTQIYHHPPRLIIVDSTLPDISGLQICRVLKHDPALRKLPLMLITKALKKEYDRLGELTLIADAFLEEKKINTAFCTEIKMLLNLFKGLDASEQQQIRLLQQDAVQVEPLNRLVQLLDQSITETTLMNAFQKLFDLAPSKNILHHMLFSLMETVLDYDAAGIFFNDKTRDTRLITYHLTDQVAMKDQQLQEWTDQVFEELKKQSNDPALEIRPYRYETISSNISPDTPVKTSSLKHHYLYPFFIENTLVGAVVFLNKQKVNYDIIFPFSLLLQEISTLMRLRHYYTEAEMLSISDPLTGLYTHQHFSWSLDREVRQSKRHQTPLTLVMISINDFRELNTQWGHAMGDEAVKTLAQHVQQNVRSIDYLARAGGRSILGLFPNTSAKDTMHALKRIQKWVSSNPLTWKDSKISFNLSIGLVELNDSINNASEFIAAAESAVENARQKGDNIVKHV